MGFEAPRASSPFRDPYLESISSNPAASIDIHEDATAQAAPQEQVVPQEPVLEERVGQLEGQESYAEALMDTLDQDIKDEPGIHQADGADGLDIVGHSPATFPDGHLNGTLRHRHVKVNGNSALTHLGDDDDYPYLSMDDGEQNRHHHPHTNGFQSGSMRFAPWNIPYKRRLQTIAVILHSLSIASTVSFFFFLCAIPLTWPLVIPYLLHMLLSKAPTDGSLRFRSERWRHAPIFKLFADYFPAKLHKTHDLPPTRKYIFGYHPHGIISHGAFAAFATEALGFSEKFPGITNSLLTLDNNFMIPIYRDYILSMGIRSVSKESITNILSKGGINGEGMGRAVTIVVGGARESLEAQPGMMHLVLGERKGFIRLAIRTGADLVPVLAFGENDLYGQVDPKTHPRLQRFQKLVLRSLKFTLPFLHGRGIFNYDVGLMPYRRPLNIVVGKPIKVQMVSDGDFDPREVDRLHGLYVAELSKMWERYKDVFAKDRKEDMVIMK